MKSHLKTLLKSYEILSCNAKRGRSFIHEKFKKHIFWGNTLSCGVLLAIGDAIQQKFESINNPTKRQYDYVRTGRMFIVGLSQGPPHHYWYLYLDKFFPHRNRTTIFKKILLDQLIAAPFFAITFFCGAGILEDKRLSECWKEFKFDWAIWPVSQYFNFMYVPGTYRVLWVNFVTVIWDIFLSYMKHKDEHLEPNHGF